MHLIQGYHEATLVALSVVVALFASYTALDLASRIPTAEGRGRYVWTLAAAVAMGGGIWSMHFIAILAFRLPLEVSYDVPLTLLSALVAVGVSGAGLFVVHEYSFRWWLLGLGGLFMGGGIASMHYIGMAAMRMPACTIRYDPTLFALSVAIAVVASMAALWLVKTLNRVWQRIASAVVMGVAICSMHYTGMAAAQFYRLSGVAVSPEGAALSPTRLGIAIAGVTVLMLCLALISTMVDRRLAVSAQREAEALRRAKEEAESANRTKDLFLTVMSHELRTPLNAILGFSEIIRDKSLGDDTDSYAGYAGDIHESGRKLLGMIEDILDMSRLQASKLPIEEDAVDIPALLRQCREELEPHASAASVTLGTPPGEPPVQVVGDRRRLMQVMTNLLANAIRFTPAGGRVEIGVDASPCDGIRIEVSDNGAGIPAADQDRVFEPFAQLSAGHDRRSEGPGLGLSLASALTALHGGWIEVVSTLGEGSVFTVVLPPFRLIEAPRIQEAATA